MKPSINYRGSNQQIDLLSDAGSLPAMPLSLRYKYAEEVNLNHTEAKKKKKKTLVSVCGFCKSV